MSVPADSSPHDFVRLAEQAARGAEALAPVVGPLSAAGSAEVWRAEAQRVRRRNRAVRNMRGEA